MKSTLQLFLWATMQRATFSFVTRQALRASQQRGISSSFLRFAEEGQAEVILVGCGAPNRGMGWYHAVQMLEKK